jgi:uncharacterized FAD-dependent dehydrogenase
MELDWIDTTLSDCLNTDPTNVLTVPTNRECTSKNESQSKREELLSELYFLVFMFYTYIIVDDKVFEKDMNTNELDLPPSVNYALLQEVDDLFKQKISANQITELSPNIKDAIYKHLNILGIIVRMK